MKPLPPLEALLAELSLSDRATVAALHACPEDELVPRLHQHAHWVQISQRLPATAAAVLARLRRMGGSCTVSWLDGLAGPLRSNIATISPRTLLSIYADHTPLETLFVLGIVWPHRTSSGDRWQIPPEIEACLPEPHALFVDVTVSPVPADDAVPLDELLCQMACLAYDGRVPLQHHGKVSHVVAQRLHGITVPAPVIAWLVATMLAGGACVAEHNHVVPAQPLLTWFAMPAHLRHQEVARAWLQAAWSEWELGPKRRPPALDVRAARRAVLHELVPQLTDTWCAIDDIRQHIKARWPDIFRGERNPLTHGWQTHWDADDGQLLTYLITGPLCWLGIVESAQHGMLIRRTALGRWLAGIAVAPVTADVEPATLEDDLSVVLSDSRNLLARFQLHRVASWHDAVTAQLSPQRVHQVLAKGMTIDELCTIVQQVVVPPPAPEVLATLRRWGAHVVHVQMTPTVLIHASDQRVLHDMIHDRRVHLPAHTLLGDSHVGIDPADAPALARRLRTAGYVVETARLRPVTFSDDELALIESALQQLDSQHPLARQLMARVTQLRADRGTPHHG